MSLNAQNALDALAIRNPCSVDWAAMDGSDTRRFCLQCQKTVYNLSEMSPCEASSLVTTARATSTPVCVRFMRGPAGQMLFRAALGAGVAALAGCVPKFVEPPVMGDIAMDTGEMVQGKFESIEPQPVTDPASVVPVAPVDVPVEPTLPIIAPPPS